MNKREFKARVNQILIQIHRGFLPEDSEATDQDILAEIPKGLSPKMNSDGATTSLVLKPFTYKWVAKRLKKDPGVTAYDMLVEAGFKEPT